MNNINKQKVTLENFENRIDYFESYIKDFFSKNGEAEGIKEVYKIIREMSDDEDKQKTISVGDIGKSNAIYYEYMDGMLKFINDIKNTEFNEQGKLDIFTEKFNMAKKNDKLFIQSLYHGELSEKSEVPISEAVTEIEMLIDFIPGLKGLKSNYQLLKEYIDSEDNNSNIKQELLNECANMFCESVNNFCESSIDAVTTLYTNIRNKLNFSKEEVQREPEFKLFI